MKRIAIFSFSFLLRAIASAQEKEIIKDSFYVLSPVEVKAVRAGENAPFARTNLSKKEISKVNFGQDIPFILNQTPSVVVNSDAGNGVGYTGIHIRGTDATRINVTLNGIPYNDAEGQGTFFVFPDSGLAVSTNLVSFSPSKHKAHLSFCLVFSFNDLHPKIKTVGLKYELGSFIAEAS